jgi:hypothetical protein
MGCTIPLKRREHDPSDYRSDHHTVGVHIVPRLTAIFPFFCLLQEEDCLQALT